MWRRFVRAIASLFGGAVSALEDPKRILEQNIRDLNDQVPKMNENIATVKANAMLLQKEVRRYEDQIRDLTMRIAAAIRSERDDIAENYALQLQRAQEALTSLTDQLQHARSAYEKALVVKKAFLKEKDRKIREAREAMRESDRSAWQARVADTLEQFEIGGMDATHDEMVMRIREDTARNEARMELALDSVDRQDLENEYDAEKIRASELVKQFKKKMAGSKSLPSAGLLTEVILERNKSSHMSRNNRHTGDSSS